MGCVLTFLHTVLGNITSIAIDQASIRSIFAHCTVNAHGGTGFIEVPPSVTRITHSVARGICVGTSGTLGAYSHACRSSELSGLAIDAVCGAVITMSARFAFLALCRSFS